MPWWTTTTPPGSTSTRSYGSPSSIVSVPLSGTNTSSWSGSSAAGRACGPDSATSARVTRSCARARSRTPRDAAPGPRGRAAPPTRGRRVGRRRSPRPATIPSAPCPSRVQSPSRPPSARSASSSPSRCASTATTSGRARTRIAPAALAAVNANVSRRTSLDPLADALRRSRSARPSSRPRSRARDASLVRSACSAWLVGWIVVEPVLVPRALRHPRRAVWLAAFALFVPVLVVERLPVLG